MLGSDCIYTSSILKVISFLSYCDFDSEIFANLKEIERTNGMSHRL